MGSNLEDDLAALKVSIDSGLYQKRSTPSEFPKQKQTQQPVVSYADTPMSFTCNNIILHSVLLITGPEKLRC